MVCKAPLRLSKYTTKGSLKPAFLQPASRLHRGHLKINATIINQKKG